VYGGGLYISTAVMSTDSVTMTGNTASYGGGFFATYTDFEGTDTDMTENTVITGGGAIYADAYSTLTLETATLTGNEAGTYGGAIMTYAETSLTDVSIVQSSASSGGGIWMYGGYGATLTGDNLSITESSATSGGGMYVQYGPVIMSNSEFSDNDAYYGGGIYAYDNDYTDSDLTLTNCTIQRNTADDGGGLLSAYLSGIVSFQSDWGEDSDDNSNDDVYLYGIATYSYGDSASFSCDTAECSE
jgi:predicted outer membrane repeat protein